MPKIVKHAEELKRVAEDNILAKLRLLEIWAYQGVPRKVSPSTTEEMSEFFPKSLRQFKAWTLLDNSPSIQDSYGKFSVIGNDTLAKRPELSSRAIELMRTLKEKSKQNDKYPDQIIQLSLELKSLKSVLDIRNMEIVKSRATILYLQKEIERLNRKIINDQREYNRLRSKQP